MGDVAALHQALVARLDALTGVTAYDGQVPDNPPAETTAGRVYPYAVVWPSAARPELDGELAEGGTDGALDWPVQVTVAAGAPDWCLVAATQVRAWLDGYELVPGAGPLREEPVALQVQRDDDVKPPRWYVPLLWRCQVA